MDDKVALELDPDHLPAAVTADVLALGGARAGGRLDTK